MTRDDLTVGALIRPAGLGALLVVLTPTSADTDLWGHVRFGLDILATRQIPARDPYSFTSDRPWINHEWLAEVFMGAAYGIAGPAGLVLLKMTLAALAILLVYAVLRARLQPGWYRGGLTAFAVLAGVAPLTGSMRPQSFSLVLFSALLVILATEQAAPRRLWWLPALFAVWVNVHGGWLVGAGVLALWAAASMYESPRGRWPVVAVGTCTVLATLVNPYGSRLWHFMYTTVGIERADIVEWLPITRLPVLILPWSLATLLALWASWRAPRLRLATFAPCALLAVMSFLVARLVGFYALAVVVLLAAEVRPTVLRTAGTGPAAPRLVAALVAGFVVLLGLAPRGHELACLRPADSIGLDSAAAAYLRDNAHGGRLLSWFNWGEYVIWHLGPALKVSMDGRRETVYSDATLDAHNRFYLNEPGARAYLEQLNPDYVWLPRQLPVSRELAGWGWRPAFESAESVVWVGPDAQPPGPPTARSVSGCFP